MAVTPAPTYAMILSTTIAAMQSVAIVDEKGQSVLLDMSPGSFNLALATAISINIASFFARQDAVAAAVLIGSATGSDLDNLVALLGVTRKPALAAEKPVLVGRSTVASTAVQVPVGWPFIIQTSSGPVRNLAVQGALEPPGVALTVQPGSQWGWVIGTADPTDSASMGVAGNTPTNLPAQFGELIAGLDSIKNPPAGIPTLPTYTVTGGAARVRYYRIVGNGVTGKTLPGPVLTVSTAPTTLGPSNHVDLSWAFGTDGGAVQPASYDVLASDDNATWVLLGTTTTTAFSDTGVVGTSYVLPTQDTSNWGVGGANQESDDDLRVRAPQTIAARSVATGTAVGAAVDALAGVAFAQGVDSAPGIGVVNVVTTAYPPSAAVDAAIDAAIATTKALGAQISKNVIAPTTISVAYTIQADSTTVSDPTTLYPAINTAIITALAGLSIGAPVHFSDLIVAIRGVTGVVAVQALTLTVGAAVYSGADVPGSPLAVYRTDAGHITPNHV